MRNRKYGFSNRYVPVSTGVYYSDIRRRRKKKKHRLLVSVVVLSVFLAVAGSCAVYCALNFHTVYRWFYKSLPAAKSMTATEQSGEKVCITWSRVKGAEGYRLYKYNSKTEKYNRIARLSAQTTTYTTDYSGRAKYAVKAYREGPFGTDMSDYKKTAGTITLSDQIDIVPHRGDMQDAPENTLAAFDQAYNKGFDSFETDVWETDYGSLLISHEKNLSVHAGVNVSVKDLDDETRKNYPIINGSDVQKYDTQYIPTLEEVMKYASAHDMTIYLHSKNAVISDRAVKKILKLTKKYGMENSLIVFTSSTDSLEVLRRNKCPSGFLKIPEKAGDVGEAVETARSGGAKIVICRYSASFITADAVKAAHGYGLSFGSYGANDKQTAFRLIEAGVDFMVTDKIFCDL